MATVSPELPLVSVVVPCRNERRFIADFLDSLLTNSYPPDRLEVLLVDGMSDDGTRDIIQRYTPTHPHLRMLDNPRRVTPAALNTGIQAARGEIIVRLDAHAEYPPNYLRQCVQALLDHPEADNVGGVRISRSRTDTVLARSVALASMHRLGAGNARFRVGAAEPQWVDTVWCGCYRRRVFDQIGYFDEALTCAQDREFNRRLRDHGGKILLVPDIECYYYPRGTIRDFCSRTFDNGYWPYRASWLAGRWIGSGRNLAPPAFVIASGGSAALAPAVPAMGAPALGILVLYVVIVLGVCAGLAWRHRDARLVAGLTFVFVATHLIYGIGSLCGMAAPLRRSTRAGGPLQSSPGRA